MYAVLCSFLALAHTRVVAGQLQGTPLQIIHRTIFTDAFFICLRRVIAVVGARVLLNIKQVVSTVLVTAHGTTVGEHTVELDHLPRQRTQRSNEPWYLVTAKD
jgi:hypothetical protein